MDAHDQPGLFDLPEGASIDPPHRATRGNNRETWTRIATAEVVITDPDALRAAATRAETGAVAIDLDAGAGHEDEGVGTFDEGSVSDVFDALVWLIWPTDGLESLLDVGAIRVLSMESAVEAQSADRGKLSWSVTVKLQDVQELRRIAAETHPDKAAEAAVSLSAAWQCSADPFAPLVPIPGITWHPGPVELQHVPARKREAEVR